VTNTCATVELTASAAILEDGVATDSVLYENGAANVVLEFTAFT